MMIGPPHLGLALKRQLFIVAEQLEEEMVELEAEAAVAKHWERVRARRRWDVSSFTNSLLHTLVR